MSDVTRILQSIEDGDPTAAHELLPLVYDELRKLAAARMAQEKPGQTLQATALVHEAYLRLVESERRGSSPPSWNSRGHFFSAAAEAMRRILLNRARDRNRLKRGGGQGRIDLSNVEIAFQTRDEELLVLDEAIDRLTAENPVCADLVKLRFFAGLSIKEAATVLGISKSSADRYWAYARAWLSNDWFSQRSVAASPRWENPLDPPHPRCPCGLPRHLRHPVSWKHRVSQMAETVSGTS